MDACSLRAIPVAARLVHALHRLAPVGGEPVFLPVALQTPGGELRWQLELSEAGAEELLRLLEAGDCLPTAAPVRHLHPVP